MFRKTGAIFTHKMSHLVLVAPKRSPTDVQIEKGKLRRKLFIKGANRRVFRPQSVKKGAKLNNPGWGFTQRGKNLVMTQGA